MLRRFIHRVLRLFRFGLWFFIFAAVLGRSALSVPAPGERARYFTHDIEFDFVEWTADALALKVSQFALGTGSYLSGEHRSSLVLDYLDLVWSIQVYEDQLRSIYSDPNVPDPENASAALLEQLDELYAVREQLGPVAESIFQQQMSAVLADAGLALGGQPIPPVLYHSTPLPLALIVSPRSVIHQDQNISLQPDLSLDEQVRLEETVDEYLNVSSLVVPVGGVGLYPTMVLQTGNINYLAEVVAHEWVHNYLTLRPLGMSYLKSPALRTMNETTAAIAGAELGRIFIERFYPDYLPEPAPPAPELEKEETQEDVFDFRAAMHETRVTVDRLLAEGKIEEAEAYMEERRVFIWNNGYRIRKLNQAYFAFYGAYADEPGGAAGEDPVGTAVRTLRSQSPTLASFINKIAWMTSFEELQGVVRLSGN